MKKRKLLNVTVIITLVIAVCIAIVSKSNSLNYCYAYENVKEETVNALTSGRIPGTYNKLRLTIHI